MRQKKRILNCFAGLFGISTYDTRVAGYSNRGHEDIGQFFGGIDFKKDIEKREALLDYLKSL